MDIHLPHLPTFFPTYLPTYQPTHLLQVACVCVCVSVCCGGALQSKAQTGYLKCCHCGKRFKWPGKFKTEKSARSARDRHIREGHGSKKASPALAARQASSALAARQRQQRKYQRTYRIADSLGTEVQSQTLRVFVLSVTRREAEHNMFSETRNHFVRQGFPLVSVRSLYGCDASSPDAEVQRNEVVMWGFQFKFIPRALRLFDEVPGLEFVFFSEDDARLKDGIFAADLVKEARAAAPSACRLGWLKSSGHTDYGCQFTSFTRAACDKFQELFLELTYGHLMSLDIWWKNVRRQKLSSGHALMKRSKKLLVKQAPHQVRGRR